MISPDADGTARGHADDAVKLVVSKGPHLVEVPDVELFGVDAAQQALEEAGFEVQVLHNEPYFGLGFVVEQSPGGGDDGAVPVDGRPLHRLKAGKHPFRPPGSPRLFSRGRFCGQPRCD